MRYVACFLFFIWLPTLTLNAQKPDAEVLNYSTLRDVSSGRLVQTDIVSIQINTRPGDKYADVYLPYSKDNKLSDITGWIEDANGKKIRDLRKSDISDRSAISEISLYEDHFVKHFQLKHDSYPYKIVYSFRQSCKEFLEIADWSPCLFSSIPTLKATLKIIIPKNLNFRKYENHIEQKCRVDTIENNYQIQWQSAYLTAVQKELYSQPDLAIPRVVIVPTIFTYGLEGSTKDWKSYGNWNYRLIQGLDILPEQEKSKVKELIQGKSDKKEIVQTLYHYLQDNTRYINVAIGIGGMKPYPATYVAQNKYGDCKALTNYMKALLSAAGIESIYTTVYAGDQPHLLIESLAGQQFNHVVLAVPLPKDTLWLENTANTNPFGYMGTFTQNRKALLILKDGSHFVNIPALKNEENTNSHRLTFYLNLTGKSVADLHIDFKGEDFEAFNQLVNELNNEDRDHYIRDYMPFDDYEVVNWKLHKASRDATSIDLDTRLNLNQYVKPLGGEYYLNLFPFKLPAFEPVANRTLPLELPYPICCTDTLIYHLPTGYAVKTEPDPVNLISKFGSCTLTSKIDGDDLIILKHLVLNSGNYSVAQYPEFYSFVSSIKEINRTKIILKPIKEPTTTN